jgi:hypothetical protein
MSGLSGTGQSRPGRMRSSDTESAEGADRCLSRRRCQLPVLPVSSGGAGEPLGPISALSAASSLSTSAADPASSSSCWMSSVSPPMSSSTPDWCSSSRAPARGPAYWPSCPGPAAVPLPNHCPSCRKRREGKCWVPGEVFRVTGRWRSTWARMLRLRHGCGGQPLRRAARQRPAAHPGGAVAGSWIRDKWRTLACSRTGSTPSWGVGLVLIRPGTRWSTSGRSPPAWSPGECSARVWAPASGSIPSSPRHAGRVRGR